MGLVKLELANGSVFPFAITLAETGLKSSVVDFPKEVGDIA